MTLQFFLLEKKRANGNVSFISVYRYKFWYVGNQIVKKWNEMIAFEGPEHYHWTSKII